MNIWQILGYIGIGGFIVATIHSIVNMKLQKKKILHEARIKEYSGVLGKVLNCFVEDLGELKWPYTEIKVNSILSDSLLVASKDLFPLLLMFKDNILNIYNFVEKNGVTDDARKKQEELFKSDLVEKIWKNIRDDLQYI